MSYSPKPNTVAWRVIRHLESLDIGAEITTGALGDALGVPSGSLQACLEGPINNGILFRRQKDKSSPRSPVFWSLTDYSASEKVPPLSARSVFDAALTQIRTADVTPEAPRTAQDWMQAAAAAATETPEPERAGPSDSPAPPIWPEHRVSLEAPPVDESLRAFDITAEEIESILNAPRFALWSDGTLQIESGAGSLSLAREETRALIDYLDVMHGREVAA